MFRAYAPEQLWLCLGVCHQELARLGPNRLEIDAQESEEVLQHQAVDGSWSIV